MESSLEQITRRMHGKPSSKRGGDGVVYTRVSSQEQAENNGSLEVQRKLCGKYGEDNRIPIVEWFGGTYESAKSDGRREFQRMLAYVRKHRNVSHIIVFNYDRFSRTGAAAAQLSEELRQEGIIIKSVTQDIDTSTAIGRLQENFFHMLNNFDNRLKSDRTIINTREVMLKGYWPYATPLGYKNLKPKHRACFHEYVITELGKDIQRGFKMILEGKLSNTQIIERLSARGAGITEKNFRYIFSNPFYAGYVTGKLTEGKLIKGHHPALIDLDDFLKVQAILSGNPIAGKPKYAKHEEVPLKIFAREDSSEVPFTGYCTKGIWYYKTKNQPAVNVRANELNNLFVKKLSRFEFDSSRTEQLRKRILSQLKERLSKCMEELKVLRKKLTEKEHMLEKLEEKFIADQITEELYQKHAAKIRAELQLLRAETAQNDFDGSNLEKAVEKCLGLAQNISQLWITADYDNKQRLQQLMFPQGILYDKQNGVVRTPGVNSLFAAIHCQQRVTAKNETGGSVKNRLLSDKVPRTGFEPAHPCGRCDLNTVRLPISPSGQVTRSAD